MGWTKNKCEKCRRKFTEGIDGQNCITCVYNGIRNGIHRECMTENVKVLRNNHYSYMCLYCQQEGKKDIHYFDRMHYRHYDEILKHIGYDDEVIKEHIENSKTELERNIDEHNKRKQNT